MRPSISIHAPLTGCDQRPDVTQHPATISIHAPLTGCDLERDREEIKEKKFQSTHPSRGATYLRENLRLYRWISIHAPLTGCDGREAAAVLPHLHFNPRTPHGVRRLSCNSRQVANDFNPRTPHGVRPQKMGAGTNVQNISIHAPLTGCDVRPQKMGAGTNVQNISIHAPLTGCDHFIGMLPEEMKDFNPRTPHGVRL